MSDAPALSILLASGPRAGAREGFDAALAQCHPLEGGYELTAMQYVKAEEVRASLLQAYTGLFREVDCVVGASLPIVAPPIGTTHVTLDGAEVTLAEACCRYNAPQN